MSAPATKKFVKEEYDELASKFRFIITDIICGAGSGHIGGALSLVEILITLYYRVMKTRPEEPRWSERDRLVLSKGHAGPVLYVTLAERGFFPAEWLPTLNQDGTRLPSHVDQNQTPGIDMTAGSLGQGLSCACGIALAGKLNGSSHRVFCIIGDGESDEGQVWEAAMFAPHYKLDNLVAICDYNELQIDGSTHQVMNLEPLADKWRAFGWEVFEMKGHDWDEIYSTIDKAIGVQGKPSMIIAHTVKGKGNILVESKVGSHNIKVPDKKSWDEYLDACGCRRDLPYCRGE